jgi:hypothetical protein
VPEQAGGNCSQADCDLEATRFGLFCFSTCSELGTWLIIFPCYICLSCYNPGEKELLAHFVMEGTEAWIDRLLSPFSCIASGWGRGELSCNSEVCS